MPKRVKLHLRYLNCRQLLHAADDVIDINIIEDPTYKVEN
jgi:SulP family sulfate permease